MNNQRHKKRRNAEVIKQTKLQQTNELTKEQTSKQANKQIKQNKSQQFKTNQHNT
jgi:hypothetical protein